MLSYHNKLRLKKWLRRGAITLAVLLVGFLVVLIYAEPYMIYSREGATFDPQATIEPTQTPRETTPRPEVKNPNIIYDADVVDAASVQELGGYYISTEMLRDPQTVDAADVLIVESTYGGRLHERTGDAVSALAGYIQRTFDRGGSVIIPAFAVGRTQELLYLLREIKQKKLVHGHDGFPVYLDSPLAEEATSVFLQCDTDCFDPETQEVLKSGQNPIWCPGLQLALTAEDSKAINSDPRPKVILSASGMCDAGRIRHHLKHNLWMAENIILIAGYQSKGTLGRALLDGVKEVRLFGEDIAVNAEIAVLHGTSGHADQKGLLNWVEAFERKPEVVFINHGDTEACEAFQALLQQKGYVAIAPFSGAQFDLAAGKLTAFPAGRPIAKKGAARKKSVFDALIAAAQRLLLVAQGCKERPNRDLTRFTAQIQALIDRWEK